MDFVALLSYVVNQRCRRRASPTIETRIWGLPQDTRLHLFLAVDSLVRYLSALFLLARHRYSDAWRRLLTAIRKEGSAWLN
jgi:hypothetical protein